MIEKENNAARDEKILLWSCLPFWRLKLKVSAGYHLVFLAWGKAQGFLIPSINIFMTEMH